MGDGRDSVERLAREMQKAAEERPFDWRAERTLCYAGVHYWRPPSARTGPAEVVRRALSSIEPRSSYSLELREGGFTDGR